eukprot:CAMPEP_0179096446 /NCGR_PEP_ID=MMETSP0796-20121207/44338_1 /TAXON_ID=73915 /ORGANISM="Pyrodinium bahamense, Strain pbaha01" /LENGTH=553 /DNA_ID=CAMNT_0020794165 /DNA_START=31 /DNA_END=1692 /DNA_ORIENTATION=+
MPRAPCCGFEVSDSNLGKEAAALLALETEEESGRGGWGLPALRRQRAAVGAASVACLTLLGLAVVAVPGGVSALGGRAAAPRPATMKDAQDVSGLSTLGQVYGGLAGVAVGAVGKIKETFGHNASKERGSFVEECRLGAGESCPISAMPRGKITAVYPGNGTQCLLSNSPPYMFQVIPGVRDKLLLYFQGGGACWDEGSTILGACTRAVAEIVPSGIFNLGNPQNPFREYTIVVLGYCSGDAHVGNVSRPWVVPTGAKVEQRGYINARSAVVWAKANLGGERLTSFVVTGSSAGALGAQLWAKTLLREFRYRDAAVIADSYAGIFPIGVQGRIQKESGLCGTELLSGPLLLACQAGTIDVQRIFEDAMHCFPHVAFASLDSKIDEVQIAFFEVIYTSLLKLVDHQLPQKEFSQDLAVIYQRYNMQPNWVSYMVNGAHHMYLPNDIMYKTRPGSTMVRTSGIVSEAVSFTGLELTGRDTPLVEWLAGFPVQAGGSVRSECRGTKPKVAAPTSTIGRVKSLFGAALAPVAQAATDFSGVGHCNPGQADKVFHRML